MKNKSNDQLDAIIAWCNKSADRRRSVLEISDPTLVCIAEYKHDALVEKQYRAISLKNQRLKVKS